MNIFEAKQILNNAGYCVINEREINLNYLLKDIFELLTSFGISATDDEVEKLMWTYINSGRKPENSNAEDILEFDIDNAPDTIIDYTSDFIDWIKRGQYKTGPVDEAKEILKKNGYLLEDTETNDDEVDELTDEWKKKRDNHASDKELDDIFWKRSAEENKHIDLVDKISNAKKFNLKYKPWTEDDVQEIRDAIYGRFDPDFGGLNNWSVQTGNNGKNYIYFKGEEVCRVAYNKKNKSVNLNFGDGMGIDFEFDPDEETFEEFIKFILTRIKEQNYG